MASSSEFIFQNNGISLSLYIYVIWIWHIHIDAIVIIHVSRFSLFFLPEDTYGYACWRISSSVIHQLVLFRVKTDDDGGGLVGLFPLPPPPPLPI
jgi:hypothetical protein